MASVFSLPVFAPVSELGWCVYIYYIGILSLIWLVIGADGHYLAARAALELVVYTWG